MSYFVIIPKVMGRIEHFALADRLIQLGLIGEAEYNAGGWTDDEIFTVKPHLKFENEADAIVFALAEGKTVHHSLPVVARLGG
jgi:hypothetical protein